MSTKQDNERLRADNEALNERLREAQELAEAQLRNVERLATKAARTDKAEAALARTHADRDTAWRRVAELERQAEGRDVALVELVMERDTAIAAAEAMATEDATAGFPS